MSDQAQPQPGASRFTPQNKTTHAPLSADTFGLIALSDYRKRRAEVLEQQEREAREARLAVRTNKSTPDQSLAATPNNASADSSEAERPKKKKKKAKAVVLSFDEGDGGAGPELSVSRGVGKKKARHGGNDGADDNGEAAAGAPLASSHDKDGDKIDKPKAKVVANTSVGIVPRALTKAALRREAEEREALRKEFLLLQAAIKATEIAIPFVFYDGTNIPGGIVRVKKGDYVWLFLDKSRKVGAELGVGSDKSSNVRRDWARVSVDDLMLVRGTMIIPHVSFNMCGFPLQERSILTCRLSSITNSISSSSTRPLV
jgi:protein FAM50